ncbi:inositol monophosphatase family protein [Brevibacillus centrosporus]|uniref:inositol monophosphatase family protein n=1 Tax=Brevibacillus centrosporus TaxID=54910 RepID=UPI002E1D7604|nr:inositol monophosphatase family protein [Brevibacillus centrosporus]
MIQPHIELVKEIVTEAGEMIRQQLDRVFLQVEQKETAHDLVTEVDRQVDAFLCERLQKIHNTRFFLTEESHPDTQLNESDYAWVIDPLDGTMNFVHGYPRFAVSVALVKGSEIVLGCIQDVTANSLYWAQQHEGAWRDGQSIQCSKVSQLPRGLIATGFSAKQWEQEPDRMTGMLSPFLGSSQGLRISGTTCLDLVSVASGELDAFWHYGLKPWDVAAGSLIVREAGGRCTDDSDCEDVLGASCFVASNTLLHKEILNKLKQ